MRRLSGSSLIVVMSFFLVLILVPRPSVSGQSGENTCLSFVEDILKQVGENCSALNRNTACYGHVRTDSTFTEEVPPDYFTKPSDLTDISTLKTIYTAPLSADQQEWGITVMSLQANVPNTLPGQSVKFILFGDVSLENAVQPKDIFTPIAAPINVTTHAAANIRSEPSLNANVKISVPDSVQLAADAISEDRQWLRVILQDNTLGWVNLQTVDVPSEATDQFPVLTSESRAPMQSIYLTTGLNSVKCNDAPPVLVIQGPKNITVNLSINGVNISLASTLIVRLTNSQSMEIVTIDGKVYVDNVSLPPGFSVTASLTTDGRSQDGPVHNLRPLNSEELDRLVALPFIPLSVLNYPIKLPTIEQIDQTVAKIGGLTCGRPIGQAAGSLQCSSLCLTSPLDSWGPQATTFYWNAAPGATSYRLNILSNPIISRETSSNQTEVTHNLTGLGFASDGTLAWSVDALYNGVTACTAGPVILRRDVSIQEAPPCPATSTC